MSGLSVEKTRCPTATLPASKRMIKGATVPGGMKARARFTWATVSDIAPNFGDYNDIAAGGNRAYVAWGDGRFGDPDVFFSEVRGAGRSPGIALTH